MICLIPKDTGPDRDYSTSVTKFAQVLENEAEE
jgi:hypothetical protein